MHRVETAPLLPLIDYAAAQDFQLQEGELDTMSSRYYDIYTNGTNGNSTTEHETPLSLCEI